jgi:hypothetical protein
VPCGIIAWSGDLGMGVCIHRHAIHKEYAHRYQQA